VQARFQIGANEATVDLLEEYRFSLQGFCLWLWMNSGSVWHKQAILRVAVVDVDDRVAQLAPFSYQFCDPCLRSRIVTLAPLRIVEGFRCTPALLYEALTAQPLVSFYTQSPAVIELKEGGKFSLFGGSVVGKFVTLEKDKKIVQTWRFDKEWEPDWFSTVTMIFSAPEYGVTRLELVQENIPLSDKYYNRDVPEKVKNGWERFFWERIRNIVGYQKIPVDGDVMEA